MRSIRENICCDVMPYGPNEVRSVRHDVTTNIFRMDQTQGQQELYCIPTQVKLQKVSVFPLLLWTDVQPVHTPVRTQAYGLALSQSNFSILPVFCLVYNKSILLYDSHIKCKMSTMKWQRNPGRSKYGKYCPGNNQSDFRIKAGIHDAIFIRQSYCTIILKPKR